MFFFGKAAVGKGQEISKTITDRQARDKETNLMQIDGASNIYIYERNVYISNIEDQ